MLNLLEITCNKYDKYIGKAGENYRIILQADISFSPIVSKAYVISGELDISLHS